MSAKQPPSTSHEETPPEEDLACNLQDLSLGGVTPPIDKDRLRQQISWRMTERNLLVPFKNHKQDGQLKIPYFKGCERAAERLARAPEFQRSSVVKVNPSLAQMHLRKLAMKAGKHLIVPVPALEDSEGGDPVFGHLIRGADGPRLMQKACTKAGAARHGEPLRLTSWPDGLRIDLFVVGCVVATREGARLGKGKGFAEMEWGALFELGAVDKDTVVATTAHEAQVVWPGKLPAEGMEEHDLPVDIISTPSRMVRVKKRLAKPECGVLWERLSEERLERMPVLRALKDKQGKKEKEEKTKVAEN